jgi:hypothetical protein
MMMMMKLMTGCLVGDEADDLSFLPLAGHNEEAPDVASYTPSGAGHPLSGCGTLLYIIAHSGALQSYHS